MGPDCGTAIINGVPLCFANTIRKGDIGIVAASGTGAQEVMTLIHKNGGGVTQVIGTGGRDLKEEIGGITMLQGLKALGEDEATKLIVVVSKPPAKAVADKVISFIRNEIRKPVVINFLGGDYSSQSDEQIRFVSTLEEAASADLVLNVCDATSSEMEEQLSVTRSLLRELGAEHTPVITVLNKCDLLPTPPDLAGMKAVAISAREGRGLEQLLKVVADALPRTHLRVRLLLPYSAGELEARITRDGKVYSREYTPDGVALEVNMDRRLLHLVEAYVKPLESGEERK